MQEKKRRPLPKVQRPSLHSHSIFNQTSTSQYDALAVIHSMTKPAALQNAPQSLSWSVMTPEAHDLVNDGGIYCAHPHKGRLKKIEASAKRPVDEEITRIAMEGLAVVNEYTVLVRPDDSTE